MVVYINFIILLAGFVLLLKSAGLLVTSAAGLALHFDIPKLIVGILIVGFGTTAPEIAVSARAAFGGNPGSAFGNAIGSVIVDDGVALALAAILAPSAIALNRQILKPAGIFLISVAVFSYFLSIDGVISRSDGMLLVALLVFYIFYVIINERKRRTGLVDIDDDILTEAEKKKGNVEKMFFFLALAIAGVLIASHWVLDSAEFLGGHFGLSNTVIGLTILAIGTSLPEIGTCIMAVRKGHGEIAVGNIIGADILNILWIIGVSALIRPIHLDMFTVHFSFISMLIIVLTMLGLIFINFKLERWKGFVLLFLYICYSAAIYYFYYRA